MDDKLKLNSLVFPYYREIHHFCVLLGYGADGICPYLVFETVANQREQGMCILQSFFYYFFAILPLDNIPCNDTMQGL